ncbi:MAG TPA: YggS family pyridoxal phosphate-dependent enzyme [Gammaproteobacteria bacterium]|nr:YggS family pyridoxal phosphate-dependent enzyme [Gammaproteobacteria bacterium]
MAAALRALKARITELERRYERPPGSVGLVAVSKTKPAEAVAAAFAEGQRDFGENQLQDARTKIEALRDLDIVWHFIGPIQSNKTRGIAEAFAWVHSLDRVKIAQRLNDQRSEGMPPLEVCIQVNVSGEATKSGIRPEQLEEFASTVSALPRLRLRGLMTIPEPSSGLEAQRRPFRYLRQAMLKLNQSGFDLDALSMGMTEDMEAAIAEGATWIRIGTAIFGPRD